MCRSETPASSSAPWIVTSGRPGRILVAEPHPVDHLDGGPEQVDGLPAVAGAQRGGALHHGDLEAGPVQPEGGHRPGDAGS
jgi:hypothetical protein